jgi:hypothetical protein
LLPLLEPFDTLTDMVSLGNAYEMSEQHGKVVN